MPRSDPESRGVEPADDELVQRVVGRGDRHAFATLVRRHQSDIRNTLRRFTHGNAAQADDLAQETFIRAWKALPGFRSDSSFRTWLFRIAYRCFLSEARRTTPEMLELDEGLPANESQIASGDFLADYAAAVLQLPPAQREAVELALQRGFAHAEIATIMELPLGTVKTHIMRGREKLQTLLGDWREGLDDE